MVINKTKGNSQPVGYLVGMGYNRPAVYHPTLEQAIACLLDTWCEEEWSFHGTLLNLHPVWGLGANPPETLSIKVWVSKPNANWLVSTTELPGYKPLEMKLSCASKPKSK